MFFLGIITIICINNNINEIEAFVSQWKKLLHSPFFSENFEMNVVYFSKACALNSFSLDDFYTVTFVTFLLYLYANNLINYFL